MNRRVLLMHPRNIVRQVRRMGYKCGQAVRDNCCALCCRSDGSKMAPNRRAVGNFDGNLNYISHAEQHGTPAEFKYNK